MKTQLISIEKLLVALLCIVLSCCISLMVPVGTQAVAGEKHTAIAAQSETEHQPATNESEAGGAVTELAGNFDETDNTIELAWKWSETKGVYTVYQSVDDGAYAKIADGLVSETAKASILVKEIEVGHAYSYFVETNNDGAIHKTTATIVEVPAKEDATPSHEVVDDSEQDQAEEPSTDETADASSSEAAPEEGIALMSEDAAESEVSVQSKKDSRTITTMSSGDITYRTHVQNDGWQGWKSNGAISGTQGRSLRLEAIQVRLTGNAANQYDVYYRVHTQNIGWMGWASNGEQSGSAGYSYRLEGIQIILVAKGSGAPGNVAGISSATSSKFVNYNASGDLAYNSTLHIQTYGDRSYNSNNGSMVMGTSGESKRLERFSIAVNNNTGLSGNIRYRTHVQSVGWQDWKSNGQAAGTSGRGLRLEALQIYLDGDLGKNYDVYYQVHVQNIGWQDWKSNGAIAGTSGQSLRLEAMRIVLVKKDSVPPSANTTTTPGISAPSENGGSPAKPSTPNGNEGSAQPSTPGQVVHEHSWVEQTATRWVPNVVTVIDRPASGYWVTIYTFPDGKVFRHLASDYIDDVADYAALVGCDPVTTCVYDPNAIPEISHTEDQGHTETYVTGYVCSGCGATK